MKTKKEILEHAQYLSNAVDNTDNKQLQELTVRLSELNWVLGTYASKDKKNTLTLTGVIENQQEVYESIKKKIELGVGDTDYWKNVLEHFIMYSPKEISDCLICSGMKESDK